MKHVFLVNPTAGRVNRADEVAVTAERIMRVREQPYIVFTTEYRGHATELLRSMAATGEPMRVYVAGGDGTYNEVAEALINAPHCAMAPYPVGTGNDFIRTLGGERWRDFLDLDSLVDGETVPMDAIVTDSGVAINSLTAGFDSWVAYYAERYRRWPLIGGAFAYKIALLNSFIRKTKNTFELEADGVHIPMRDYLFVVMMNGRFYGSGYQPAPRAKLDDGALELVTVDRVGRGQILKLTKPYRDGTLEQVSDIIHIRAAREIEIRSPKQFKLGLDGQMSDARSVRCRIAPGALRVILPRGWSAIAQPGAKGTVGVLA